VLGRSGTEVGGQLCWPRRWLGTATSVIDGTLIEDRSMSHPRGPTPGVDLWWSGKHANHRRKHPGPSTAPDGWPLWTSEVRPGREHDTTATAPSTRRSWPALITWIAENTPRASADLGLRRRIRPPSTIAFQENRKGREPHRGTEGTTTKGPQRQKSHRRNAETRLLKTSFQRPCATSASAPGRSAPNRRPPALVILPHRPRPHKHDHTHSDTHRLRGKAQCGAHE